MIVLTSQRDLDIFIVLSQEDVHDLYLIGFVVDLRENQLNDSITIHYKHDVLDFGKLLFRGTIILESDTLLINIEESTIKSFNCSNFNVDFERPFVSLDYGSCDISSCVDLFRNTREVHIRPSEKSYILDIGSDLNNVIVLYLDDFKGLVTIKNINDSQLESLFCKSIMFDVNDDDFFTNLMTFNGNSNNIYPLKNTKLMVINTSIITIDLNDFDNLEIFQLYRCKTNLITSNKSVLREIHSSFGSFTIVNKVVLNNISVVRVDFDGVGDINVFRNTKELSLSRGEDTDSLSVIYDLKHFVNLRVIFISSGTIDISKMNKSHLQSLIANHVIFGKSRSKIKIVNIKFNSSSGNKNVIKSLKKQEKPTSRKQRSRTSNTYDIDNNESEFSEVVDLLGNVLNDTKRPRI